MRTLLLRVSAMTRTACRLAILALCAAGLAPVTAAQAQWQANGQSRRPAPLYPYELQPGQSYAVEVSPGTYVIHRPSNERGYRGVSRRARQAAPRYRAAPKARVKPRRTHANRALIEELRRRDARRARLAAERAAKRAAKLAAKRKAKRAAQHAGKSTRKSAGRKPDKIVHTRRVVRDKPLVIETRRVVQDPPKVITRRHYVEDLPPRGATGSIAPRPTGNADPRVIHADAEITILGPDRMSIRLVRKDGQRLDAKGPR